MILIGKERKLSPINNLADVERLASHPKLGHYGTDDASHANMHAFAGQRGTRGCPTIAATHPVAFVGCLQTPSHGLAGRVDKRWDVAPVYFISEHC